MTGNDFNASDPPSPAPEPQRDDDATFVPAAEQDPLATYLPAGSSRAVDAGDASSQDASTNPKHAMAGEAAARQPAGIPEIDGYRILRKLGQGGMGTVFLAEEEHLARQVAIKIVTQSFHESLSVRQRFEAEIRTLATLQHASIAQLFTAGTYRGLPYFVMEYVDGPTLEQVAAEPMQPRKAAELLRHLCEAVEYCHQQGILHRDLKPSNILLKPTKRTPSDSTVAKNPPASVPAAPPVPASRTLDDRDREATLPRHPSKARSPRDEASGRSGWHLPTGQAGIDGYLPKIADFGLAKVVDSEIAATRTGEVLGTPGYMPPEQARGSAVELTAACDVYALGAVLYRLLTGRPPFAAPEPMQAVMQVLSKDPVRPRSLVANIPTDLETICLKCLEKPPGKRYGSAAEMHDDLGRYLEGIPIQARPAGFVERSVKWTKRNPTLAVSCLALVLMVAAAFAAQSWHARVLSKELARTQRLAEHGSELSLWLIQDHLAELNSVSGTTRSRHELVQRVQRFLDASRDDMPPDSKYTKQLGYSYTRLASVAGGDDQNNLGDLETAEANYQKSLQLYDDAQRQGEAPVVMNKLRADTLLALARVYAEMQDESRHQRHLQQAGEIISRLEADDWAAQFLKLQWLKQQVEQSMNANQFDEALQTIAKAQQLLDAPASDADPVEKNNQEIWLSSNRSRCLEFLGQLRDATAAYERTVALAKTDCEARPQDALAKRRYGSILVQYADNLFSREQAEAALQVYEEALAITAELYRKDPVSVELAVDLATKQARLATVNRYLEDFAAAEAAISRAIEIHEALQAEGKRQKTFQQSLATYLLAKADLCIATSRRQEAKACLERHDRICASLLEAEPDSAFALNQMAEHHFQRAVLLVTDWFEGPLDAAAPRESETYKQIDAAFARSLRYFDRIAEQQGLDFHQGQYRQRVEQMRKVVESSIDQMQATEDGE